MLSDNNSVLYKRLYSENKIDKILSDKLFIKKILLFESMLAKTKYELKFMPYKAYQNIKKAISETKLNSNILENNLEYSGVITVNILDQIRKNIHKDYIAHLHYGASSQDAIDTAIILQLKETRNLFINNLKKISYKLFNLAIKNKNTFTIGRTRNKYASLTTFGFKVSNWLMPILRNVDRLNNIYDNGLLYTQLGGTVGNLASFNTKGNQVKKKLSKYLDLGFDDGSWQNQRDRIVDFCNILSMITASIGKIAKDILVLAQDEVSEITFIKAGKSSSMPHKNNPILAEILISLAKLNSNHLFILHDALMHKNERDGVSWTMEWKALYSMLRLTSSSLNHFNKCLSNIKINKEKMRRNIDETFGVIFSDYLFQKLLKTYSYNKLQNIFPNLIQTAQSEKKHLLDVINTQLENDLKIDKEAIFSRCKGINDIFIEKTKNKLHQTF